METIGQRVRELRKERGLSQGDIAAKCPFTKGWLSLLERDDIKRPSANYMRSLAGILGTNQNWIFTGKGVRDQLESGPLMVPIPLVAWGDIESMGNGSYIAEHQPSEYVYSSKPVSPRAYALRVRGDSMESQGGLPSFPPGTIIIVDPDKDPASHSCVVIKLPESSDCILRQLVREGPQSWLRPLNPRYPVAALPQGATIHGVVVQAIFELD